MTAWYVDTSVLGAYYCPEPASSVAQAFLQEIGRPVISSVTEVELASLVSKKKRLGELGRDEARAVLAKFSGHLDAGHYHRLLPADAHYREARELIGGLQTPLRTLDALHLALALVEGLPVATADRVMHRAARASGIESRYIKAKT